MRFIAMVVPQLKEIQEDILRADPAIDINKLEAVAANAFKQKYLISPVRATTLFHDQQWDRWLSKHQPEFSQTVTSQKLKAIDEGKGRFVEYDLITNDVDRADESGETYPDLIPRATIAKVEQQMIGSLINLNDPVKILDYPSVKQKYVEGAKFAGIGHEHHYDQDIVPVLEVVKVKAVDNNSRLRVTARLNEYSQRADDTWQMIKNKTLGYASVEMKELASHVERVGDKYVNVITDMLVGGWTLTSKAVNGQAAQVGCFVKALDSSLIEEDNQKVNKMADENKVEEKVEEPVVEPVKEPKVEEAAKVEEPVKAEADPEPAPAEEVVEDEKVKALEEKVKALEEKLKSLDTDKALADSVVDDLKEKVKASLESDSKALVELDQTKFEEKVKAIEEKLKSDDLSIEDKFAEIGKLHNQLE